MNIKYKMIKEAIKAKILEGTIVPHQKISSESEMMKQFEVSRHTVRLAVGELVNEGLLYREQGAGTFCADRSLKTSKRVIDLPQKNIAIITTFISEYIFPTIIRGAESYLSEHGYHVSIFNTNNNHDLEKRILETILTGRYDGIIIEPTKSASTNPNLNYYLRLERLNIPYIMINAPYEELEPISVTLDDEKGGFIQAEHLMHLGHREIVGIYKTDDKQGANRLKGFIKAHRAYNLPVNPNNIITYGTNDLEEKPIKELERLLTNKKEFPTAIACYNDQTVLNLLDVLRKKKLHVPRDISIVGYDDSILAEASEVKLTSVKHPKSKLGVEAGRMIINLIKRKYGNSKKIPESIIFEPELVVRNSTKGVGKENNVVVSS